MTIILSVFLAQTFHHCSGPFLSLASQSFVEHVFSFSIVSFPFSPLLVSASDSSVMSIATRFPILLSQPGWQSGIIF